MSGHVKRKKMVPEASQGRSGADNAPGRRLEQDPMKYSDQVKDSMSEMAGHSYDPRSYGFFVTPGSKRRKNGGITGFGY